MGDGRLTIPMPLRPDFVVTVEVPRDITAREAARLADFVRSLAALKPFAAEHTDTVPTETGEE